MKEETESFIKGYVKACRSKVPTATSWEEPLVAFADAQDPLFPRLKQLVDAQHFLPADLQADAKTVVSYFLPFTRETTLSNARGRGASEQWAKSYVETNQLITNLSKAICEMLEQHGFRGAVTLPTHNFDEEKLVSNWSQKHVAYIAGLGTFGLHSMIITEKGCCGRLGSIVTNAEITPTQRSAKEFCLFKLDGSCGACVKKCRPKALKADSLDKRACYEECLTNARKYAALGLADVCGKCVVNVPCSFTNPSRAAKT
ncbi:MAG: epoxyqueuosine reductase [Candidatus Bathyarchaeia archaeon]